MRKLLYSMVSLLFICSCSKGIVKPFYLQDVVEKEELEKIENKFERFRQQVLGHFSNKEEKKANNCNYFLLEKHRK